MSEGLSSTGPGTGSAKAPMVRRRGSEKRIALARAHVLTAGIADHIAMSFAPLGRRSMVLVELETSGGLVGYGESWTNFPRWAPQERLATLEHGVFPLVLGEEATQVESLHRKMVLQLEPLGRQWGAPGPIMQAISAVDIALWDLLGKIHDCPVADLIGRVRDDVPVYASSVGPEQAYDQALACRDSGFRAVKAKLGFGQSRDESILQAVREAVGADIELYVDANQAWTLEQAVAMGDVLRTHDVALVEEPIKGNALGDLEEFHRLTGLDVATGENLYGSDAFRPYLGSQAVRVVQPDVSKTGGITEAVAVARHADSVGRTVIPHLFSGAVAFAATLQLAACAQSVTSIEYDIRSNPLRDPLWLNGPTPNGGRIDLPKSSGLGFDVDRNTLLRHLDSSIEVTE